MKTMSFVKKLSVGLALLGVLVSAHALAKKEVNVAYFTQWPTANQMSQFGGYSKALGMPVKFKPFDSGGEMTAAMLSGDIDISYSQGFIPYMIAVSKGIDLRLIGIAISYSESDNCVIRNDAGISIKNLKALEGKKVATPVGGITQYKMLKILEHFGVDAKKVKILTMANTDVASALGRGDIVMGCAFGGPVETMKKYGKVWMTGAEQEKQVGLKVFDVISARGEFVDKHPELVQKFMDVTQRDNALYNANPSKYYSKLAKASGMGKKDAVAVLKTFTFMTAKKQLSKAWLGGDVQRYAAGVGSFLESQKIIKKSATFERYQKLTGLQFLKKIAAKE